MGYMLREYCARVKSVLNLSKFKLYKPSAGYYLYFLAYNGAIVYVGATTNLVNRLDAHTGKTYNEVYYRKYSKNANICAIEKKYILLLKPKYNEVHNPLRKSKRMTLRFKL